MQNRLTRLVVIACLAMFGIICMQGYWLAKFYKEKKEELVSDVETALLETHMKNGTSFEINQVVLTLSNELLKNVTDPVAVATEESVSRFEAVDQTDSLLQSIAQKLLLPDTSSLSQKNISLTTYKKQVKENLAGKDQHFPIELALFSETLSYLEGTIDSFSFSEINTKTDLTMSLPIQLSNKLAGRMQVAVPNADLIIVKKMGPIMILSLALLAGSTVSLILMVVIFYRQKRVTEIRNDFMNNMTHELKTPISSVSLALELLQDQSVTMAEEEQKEYFKVANNELMRLTLLVDKVLKMASFEKSEVSVHKERFAVKPWLEDIVISFKPKMELDNVQMAVTIFPDSMYIRADKVHFTNVMQNLIENAIKYGDKEKENISIQVNAWESDEESFISVKDNGKGIPDVFLTKVFDKFFRVPTGDEHETKGYGLGLSYVQEIIRLHEGEITVESTNRIGTRFKLCIPKK